MIRGAAMRSASIGTAIGPGIGAGIGALWGRPAVRAHPTVTRPAAAGAGEGR